MMEDRTKRTSTGVWALPAVVLLLWAVGDVTADDQSSLPQPFVHPSPNTNFVVGENFTLICRIPKKENTSFSWVTPNKDKVPLVKSQPRNVSGDEYLTSRMTVQNASLQDSGQYICNVWVEGHVNISYPYEVEIQNVDSTFVFRHIDNTNRSTVIAVEEEIEVVEGDRITLECGAAKSLYSGVTLDAPKGASLQFRNSDSSLAWLLTNERQGVALGDAGAYVCRGSVNSSSLPKGNTNTTTTTTTTTSTLHLKIRPQMAPYLSDETDALSKTHAIEIEEHTPHYTIHCRARGTPPPRITWTKNGLPLTSAGESGPGVRKGGHEVFFLIVKQKDAGLYVCRAENRAGVVNASVSLKIIKPVNKTGNTNKLKETHNLFLREGEKNVTLQCEVHKTPSPQILWTKEGLAFNSSSDPKGPKISKNGLRVTFPVLALSDTGMYKCENKKHPGISINVFNLEVAPGHHWTYRLCGIFIIVVLMFLFMVSMLTQSCHSKGACCATLEGAIPYSTMPDISYSQNTQQTGNAS